MNKKLMAVLGVLAACGCAAYKVLSNKEPEKHSIDWIKNLSDSQWENEREVIRQKFCSPAYDDDSRIGFQELLGLFDKIKSDRDWAGKVPQGPGYHREHGYNLYKD